MKVEPNDHWTENSDGTWTIQLDMTPEEVEILTRYAFLQGFTKEVPDFYKVITVLLEEHIRREKEIAERDIHE